MYATEVCYNDLWNFNENVVNDAHNTILEKNKNTAGDIRLVADCKTRS